MNIILKPTAGPWMTFKQGSDPNTSVHHKECSGISNRREANQAVCGSNPRQLQRNSSFCKNAEEGVSLKGAKKGAWVTYRFLVGLFTGTESKGTRAMHVGREDLE
jgi:hypothetical protein